jgi:hypothetical protein
MNAVLHTPAHKQPATWRFATTQPDFQISDHGSIWILTPISEAGIMWCDEYMPADCQRWNVGFAIEHRFIEHVVTGIVAALMPDRFDTSADPGTRRALQTLLHPELLGTAFQFLALTRDIAPDLQLSGFKFARTPRVLLGL